MTTLPKPIHQRTGAQVNAYLILQRNGELLLQRRQNTGYCDGLWSLVAGHVEDGEPATLGMIREAREEIALHLAPSQLNVVHIMHRKTNRLNVDIFFSCTSWEGTPQNGEPHKCSELKFFPLHSLPENLVPYNRLALESVSAKIFYSELGWAP